MGREQCERVSERGEGALKGEGCAREGCDPVHGRQSGAPFCQSLREYAMVAQAPRASAVALWLCSSGQVRANAARAWCHPTSSPAAAAYFSLRVIPLYGLMQLH